MYLLQCLLTSKQPFLLQPTSNAFCVFLLHASQREKEKEAGSTNQVTKQTLFSLSLTTFLVSQELLLTEPEKGGKWKSVKKSWPPSACFLQKVILHLLLALLPHKLLLCLTFLNGIAIRTVIDQHTSSNILSTRSTYNSMKQLCSPMLLAQLMVRFTFSSSAICQKLFAQMDRKKGFLCAFQRCHMKTCDWRHTCVHRSYLSINDQQYSTFIERYPTNK